LDSFLAKAKDLVAERTHQ